jgi:hypothetical protein
MSNDIDNDNRRNSIDSGFGDGESKANTVVDPEEQAFQQEATKYIQAIDADKSLLEQLRGEFADNPSELENQEKAFQSERRDEFKTRLDDLKNNAEASSSIGQMADLTSRKLKDIEDQFAKNPSSEERAKLDKQFEELRKDFEEKLYTERSKVQEPQKPSREQIQDLLKTLEGKDDPAITALVDGTTKKLEEIDKNFAKDKDTVAKANAEKDLHEEFQEELRKVAGNKPEHKDILLALPPDEVLDPKQVVVQGPPSGTVDEDALKKLMDELKEKYNVGVKDSNYKWGSPTTTFRDTTPGNEDKILIEFTGKKGSDNKMKGYMIKVRSSDQSVLGDVVALHKAAGNTTLTLSKGNKEFQIKMWMEASLQQPDALKIMLHRPFPHNDVPFKVEDHLIERLKKEAAGRKPPVDISKFLGEHEKNKDQKNSITINRDDQATIEKEKVASVKLVTNLNPTTNPAPVYQLTTTKDIDPPPGLTELIEIANREAEQIKSTHAKDSRLQQQLLSGHAKQTQAEFADRLKFHNMSEKELLKTGALRKDGAKDGELVYGRVYKELSDGSKLVHFLGATQRQPKLVKFTPEQAQGLNLNQTLSTYRVKSGPKVSNTQDQGRKGGMGGRGGPSKNN